MQKDITILLIDDNEEERNLFRQYVRDIDDSIHCVMKSGIKTAIDHLSDNDNILPDLIFLDLLMPGPSGRECIEELKKNKRLENIPLIVYSTSNSVTEDEECKAMGAAHFYSKHSDPGEIYYMISQVINDEWA